MAEIGRRWIVIAAIAGVLAGAGALRLAESLTVDAALDRQKADLLILTESLRKTEAALTKSQNKVQAEVVGISEGLARAQDLPTKFCKCKVRRWSGSKRW